MSAAPNPNPARPVALIVAAREDSRAPLAALLSHRGIDAEFVADGASALEFASRRSPSVVLVRPVEARSRMDTVEVMRALRSLPGLGDTPIVVTLKQDDEAGLERAFESGATDVCSLDASDSFVARRVAFVLRANSVLMARARTSDSTDEVTGLPDERAFTARIGRAMNHASVDGTCMAVLCLELDRFGEVTAGLDRHAAQSLLVGVSERLNRTLRETDTLRGPVEHTSTSLTRLSGAKFSILLEGLERPEDAAKVSQRVIDVLGDPFEIDGSETLVGSNVGIAAFPSQVQGPAVLLAQAEAALLGAREEGRNTVRYADPELNSKVFERLTLETNLRLAFQREEFVVYYQPRIEISSGRLLSFEALVRWQHPELGLVAPAQFIPLAEETGLIVPLGEWVLSQACRQNRAWQNAGLPPVSVSVNLSSVQFRKPDLYESVVRVLGESGLDPTWLELELTESLLMQNAESVVETLKRFRSAGIKLSIDDFGTGYSSLSYLKRFPIDALKIDRSFISEVTTNSDDAALATSIILMGRSLKLRVVAEGVETESQLSFLRIMQCDEVQGYLFSPPVPAVEATAMLRDGLARQDVA